MPKKIKKSCENVNILGWPLPPQLWKFTTFFFFFQMNPSLSWSHILKNLENLIQNLHWFKSIQNLLDKMMKFEKYSQILYFPLVGLLTLTSPTSPHLSHFQYLQHLIYLYHIYISILSSSNISTSYDF